MKKLITPLPAGGVPVNLEDVLNLQNVNHDAYKQLLYGVGYYYVLSGVEVVTQDTTLKTVTMSEGWVWMDDEIRYVPAYSGAYPYFIKSDIDIFTKMQMSDGTSKNVYVYKSATQVSARPVSVQCIECNPLPAWVFKNMLVSNVFDALNKEINTRQTQITAEIQARTNAVTQLTQALANLTDIVNTKITKRAERVEWTDMDLSPGGWSNLTQSGFQKAQYMRDEMGIVRFRGQVQSNYNGGGNLTYMPNGFRTTYSVTIGTSDSSARYNALFVQIYGSAYINNVGSVPSNTRPIVDLSAFSYLADV